jgi:hypothetical protein
MYFVYLLYSKWPNAAHFGPKWPTYSPTPMNDPKNKPLAGMTRIKVTVPTSVAEYYERRANDYGGSVSAAAAPVLCAMARGEIKQGFTQEPGADFRPK